MTTQTVVTALNHWLAEGDELERCCAAQTLGKLGDTQAVPSLLERLQDEDIDVVLDAIAALGQLRHTDAVESLLKLLKEEPEGEIKAAALEALITFADARVTPMLLALAAGRPADMHWEAEGEWDIWWDMQLTAVKALGQLQVAEAVPVLTELLHSEELVDIESELLSALANLGELGYVVLEQQLRTATVRTRRRAAQVLGSPKDSSTVRAVIVQGLTDTAAEVRVATIQSLAARGGGAYYQTLLRMLKDKDAAVRQAALHALTQLTPYIQSHNWDWEALLAVLTSDTDATVLTETLKIIAALAADLPEVGWTAVAACLNSPYANVRHAACDIYVAHGDAQVQPVLLEIFSNADYDAVLRSAAAMSLSQLGEVDGDSLNALTAAIQSPLQPIRFAALRALMALAMYPAADTIRVVSNDSVTTAETPMTSEEAMLLSPLQRVIATLQGATVTMAAPHAEGTNSELATEADVVAEAVANPAMTLDESTAPDSTTQADSQVDNHGPQSTLEAILQNNATAAMSLQQHAAEPDKALLTEEAQTFKALADENIALGERLFIRKKVAIAQDVRYLSARVLAESDAPEVIAALFSALAEPDWVLQQESTTALGHIFQCHPPQDAHLAAAMRVLPTQLSHPEWQLRLATIRTLSNLPHSEVIPLLVKHLTDSSVAVGVAAITGLVTRLQAGTLHVDWNRQRIIEQYLALLTHTEAQIRVAAAHALGTLQYHAGLAALIDAAFVDGGHQAGLIGTVLRQLDQAHSETLLLERLTTVTGSAQRKVVMEVLAVVSAVR